VGDRACGLLKHLDRAGEIVDSENEQEFAMNRNQKRQTGNDEITARRSAEMRSASQVGDDLWRQCLANDPRAKKRQMGDAEAVVCAETPNPVIKGLYNSGRVTRAIQMATERSV
jgi:hypothetical protein